jgi:hypothetical protein
MLESSSLELLRLSLLRSTKGLRGYYRFNITASGRFFQEKNLRAKARKPFLVCMCVEGKHGPPEKENRAAR